MPLLIYSRMSHCMTTLRVHAEVSNIIYLNVFDQKADDKQTLLAIVNNLYEEFMVKEGHKWVMVEGDAKTYDILQCIKTEYRDEMYIYFQVTGIF